MPLGALMTTPGAHFNDSTFQKHFLKLNDDSEQRSGRRGHGGPLNPPPRRVKLYFLATGLSGAAPTRMEAVMVEGS